MSRRQKTFITADLSDEQVEEMIDSVSDCEEGDYNSDDSVLDPNYEPDEITAGINAAIDNAINAMSQGETSDAFILQQSFSVDEGALPSASSTIHMDQSIENIDLLSSGDEEVVEVPVLI